MVDGAVVVCSPLEVPATSGGKVFQGEQARRDHAFGTEAGQRVLLAATGTGELPKRDRRLFEVGS